MRLLSFLVILAFAAPSWAQGDPQAGESKSRICAACHGIKGISPNDIWPNLAGQKYGYLVKQIKAFKDGTRVDPSMAPMVNPLTEQDIEDIAAWYSQLNQSD